MRYAILLFAFLATQTTLASVNICGQVRTDKQGQRYLVVPTSPASWAGYLLVDQAGGKMVSSLTEMEFVCLEGEIDNPPNSGLGVFTVTANP